MLICNGLRAAIPAMVLGALLAGCSAATTTDGPGDDMPYVAPEKAEAAAEAAAAKVSASPSPTPEPEDLPATEPPMLVRDAFAGLQATYQDGCKPGGANCAYFLGRVNEELTRLDRAMKTDDQGPGHFPEPIAWIGTLRTALKGDLGIENLEKHRTLLLGTRDKINTWMQGHPEDYR
ncbi:hypothetical protein AB0M10_03510 [Streptomyces sp. NPDC051840]|uniref:hypothetical protein n=1 Tax=Streptomyces sp. NPDC051840 TaxID=3154752 RepID=UPI0034290AD4